MKTPTLDDIPVAGESSLFGNPITRRVILALFAAGTSVAALAERTGIPSVRLEKYLRIYDDEMRQILSETRSTETAENLLRGSLVDSILYLINTRNDSTTSKSLGIKISMYLIQQNFGFNKLGIGEKDEDFFVSALRGGKSRSAAIDDELQRLLQGEPQAAAMLKPLTRSGTPELSRQVSANGSTQLPATRLNLAEKAGVAPVLERETSAG